jgi:hypothetical protein
LAYTRTNGVKIIFNPARNYSDEWVIKLWYGMEVVLKLPLLKTSVGTIVKKLLSDKILEVRKEVKFKLKYPVFEPSTPIKIAPNVLALIRKCADKIRNNKAEYIYIIDMLTSKIIYENSGDKSGVDSVLSKAQLAKYTALGYKNICLIHNHPQYKDRTTKSVGAFGYPSMLDLRCPITGKIEPIVTKNAIHIFVWSSKNSAESFALTSFNAMESTIMGQCRKLLDAGILTKENFMDCADKLHNNWFVQNQDSIGCKYWRLPF